MFEGILAIVIEWNLAIQTALQKEALFVNSIIIFPGGDR